MTAVDPIGWFIGTLHQTLGHDQTAAFLGALPGSQADCILCRYEGGVATREEAARALNGLPPVSTALALLGHCSCCGQTVPGTEPRDYPGRVRLDYHRHPRPGWWLCIGSRSVMRRVSDR